MRLMLAGVILVCGCLAQPEVLERFVCCDGVVVDNPQHCANRTSPCPAEKAIDPPQKGWKPPITTLQKVVKEPENAEPCGIFGCPAGTEYVSSKSSAKYHRCDCGIASRLSKKNIRCYGSEEEAKTDGKVQCGICSGGG